ncbi:MAG TPA: hypothetical protein VFA44_07830 [Gaiellaceae bacterium]|nr:hypothetical protein [Gaiellaceae bacterium]
MNAIRLGSLVAGLASAAALAASASSATTPADATGYHPKIDPAKFTTKITNPWMPLPVGTTHRYSGVRDGAPTRHVMTVTRRTRTVMGVRCVVVSDVVTQNQSLVEKTTDWYAQDAAGNVWYFGENTAEYQNGVVTSTAGTWEAGVDRALPGIVMPAKPRIGLTFQQEYRPGVALDRATVVGLNGVAHTPGGTFRHLLVTFDKNPLDPSKKEHKYFARGIGFVYAVLKGGGHSEITRFVK